MALIYETDNFKITSAEPPHVYVDRAEGGNIRLKAKFKIRDRTQLTPELAIEYIKLSMVAGEALTIAMVARGVAIGLVNYQDMGNFSVFEPGGPTMHTQIFGRATTATIQKYGDAVQLPHIESGFYEDFQPFNEGDLKAIRAEIERLLATDKYRLGWD